MWRTETGGPVFGNPCGIVLLESVRRELGPVAVVGEINFVTLLPKTRTARSCAACSRRWFSTAILATSPRSRMKDRSRKPGLPGPSVVRASVTA
jgi:hypothetical protein